MKYVLSTLLLLLCLTGCQPQRTAVISRSQYLNVSASIEPNMMAVALYNNKSTDCSDPSANIEFTVTGAGPSMSACQGYDLITSDSRNGEFNHCDSDSKFLIPPSIDWSYNSQNDTWSSTQPLSGSQDRNVAIPGNYVIHFKSADGIVKTVDYQVRNPYGNPNACIGRNSTAPTPVNPVPVSPSQPVNGVAYPLTIVTQGQFQGTYNSYSEFAAKINAAGFGGSCVVVDGIKAYGPNFFPPCVQLTSTNHPVPTPAPTPAPVSPSPTPVPVPPTPSGSCPAKPGNAVMQTLLTEGSNNYVFDGPRYSGLAAGSIQVYPINLHTADGRTVSAGTVNFTDFIIYTPSTLQVEIAFSKCPGDFDYYKSPAAASTMGNQTFTPCGMITGPIGTISWAPTQGYDICTIPDGEQWYINWRIVNGTCPASRGVNCGQVMMWHRTY